MATKTIKLGSKSIKIKRPGVFKAKAKRAGKSTRAYAQAHKHAKGVLGRQARLAISLMGMGKKRKRKAR